VRPIHRRYKRPSTGSGQRSDWRGDRTDFSPEIAEFALAHIKKGVEGVYHRATSIAKRRELMEAWVDYLGVVEGDNIVSFAKPA